MSSTPSQWLGGAWDGGWVRAARSTRRWHVRKLFLGGSLVPPLLLGRVKSSQREGNKKEREAGLGATPSAVEGLYSSIQQVWGCLGFLCTPGCTSTLSTLLLCSHQARGRYGELKATKAQRRTEYRRDCEAVLTADPASCKTNKPLKAGRLTQEPLSTLGPHFFTDPSGPVLCFLPLRLKMCHLYPVTLKLVKTVFF